MDVDYNKVINFEPLRKLIDEEGLKIKAVAVKVSMEPNTLSRMLKNEYVPKSDTLVKLAYVLKVPVSRIVDLKLDADPVKANWFDSHHLPYLPMDNVEGKLTYQPLWNFLDMYLEYLYNKTGKEKTVNDVFDLIEPCRRRNNIKCGAGKEIAMKSVEARFGKDYKPVTRKRKYEAKGLTPETRHKLRADLPVNIRTIYDICKFLGCPVDWVVSYK